MSEPVIRDETERERLLWRAEVEAQQGALEAAQRERDEAVARLKMTYCAYCGAEFPLNSEGLPEAIGEHIHTCPAHPMRKVETERDEAQARQDRYACLANERANAIRLLEAECDELKREVARLREELDESVGYAEYLEWLTRTLYPGTKGPSESIRKYCEEMCGDYDCCYNCGLVDWRTIASEPVLERVTADQKGPGDE